MTIETPAVTSRDVAIATIRAAIDKLESLRDAAAPGPWTASHLTWSTNSILVAADNTEFAETGTGMYTEAWKTLPADPNLELAAVMRNAVDPLLTVFWGALDAARNGRVVWGALPLARTILGQDD